MMRTGRRFMSVTAILTLIAGLQIFASTSAGADLRFIKTFGRSTGGPNDLGHPTDVAMDADGNMYTVEPGNHRIEKFDESGNYLMTIGAGFGTDPGQLQYPEAIDLNEDGTALYVTDSVNSRIEVFGTVSGEFIAAFGKAGTGDGELNVPLGLDWYDNKVYVADSRNHRVAIFSDSGTFIKNFGSEGATDGKFAVPVGIAAGDAGIFVGDEYWHTLQKFTLDGAFVKRIAESGTGPGQLNVPEQLALCQIRSDTIGLNTFLYIVDENDQEVEEYVEGFFGNGFATPFTGDSSPGTHFAYPHGVGCIDREGDEHVVVASTDDGLIYHFKDTSESKVDVNPNKSPGRLQRREALTFEISHDAMTKKCKFSNAKGSVTIPQAEDIGLGDDTFGVKGPPATIQPKKVLDYAIPIDPGPMKAFKKALDKNKALKVEVSFDTTAGCTLNPVKVRYTIK